MAHRRMRAAKRARLAQAALAACIGALLLVGMRCAIAQVVPKAPAPGQPAAAGAPAAAASDVPPYGLGGALVRRLYFRADGSPAPGLRCKPGRELRFPGVTLEVPTVCAGPYQQVWRNQAIFSGLERVPLLQGWLLDKLVAVGGPPSAGSRPPDPDAGSAAPAGLCPSLLQEAGKPEAHDPALVCRCAASYLQLLWQQATALWEGHPELRSDAFFSRGYGEMRWIALHDAGGEPPGWKRRCDLLAAGAPPSAAAEEPAPPVRPLPKPGESKADYAADMQAYLARWRDWQAKRQAGYAAAIKTGFEDKARAAQVAGIPAVAYVALIGGLIAVWDMEDAAATDAALGIARRFAVAVDEAEFSFWTTWSDAKDLLAAWLDEHHQIVIDRRAFIARMQPACIAFDRRFASALQAGAAAIRAVGAKVRQRHDLIQRDLRLWSDFAAHDGFPRRLADGTPEALGGFLGLEAFLFQNARSLALHPGLFSVLRARAGEDYDGTVGLPCSGLHLEDLPADFQVDLYVDRVERFAPGDGGALGAIAALDPGQAASIALRYDVLTAPDAVDLFASGADPSEDP
jgi:hypothetical protein